MDKIIIVIGEKSVRETVLQYFSKWCIYIELPKKYDLDIIFALRKKLVNHRQDETSYIFEVDKITDIPTWLHGFIDVIVTCTEPA